MSDVAEKQTADKTSMPQRKNRLTSSIILLIVGILILGGSALLALSHTMSGWELHVFRLINSAWLPHWVTSDIAKPLSNAVWGIMGLIVLFLIWPKFRLRAWRYLVAGGGAYVLEFIVGHFVNRARPEGLVPDVVLRANQGGPGFPSGHVSVLTALSLTAWPYLAWYWRLSLIVFVGAEAWSRIFLGVHAPLDIVGGIGIGFVVVAVIRLLPQKLRSIFWL